MWSAIIDIRTSSGSLGATVKAALKETNTCAAEAFRLRVVTSNKKRFLFISGLILHALLVIIVFVTKYDI